MRVIFRVRYACKSSSDDSVQPNHEIEILSSHENDVNYLQFSGCAVASRFSSTDASKEDCVPKFKNSWFNHDNIFTCSRDGSAIIWIPRSHRLHKAYHLKVPPPPMSPQPSRGGPCQRILPTLRGVNMIVWSFDNHFVLAAIMGMMYLYDICYDATITAGHLTMELVGFGMLDIPSLIHAYVYQNHLKHLLGRTLVHYQALLCKATRSSVVHSITVEHSLLLEAQTLVQELVMGVKEKIWSEDGKMTFIFTSLLTHQTSWKKNEDMLILSWI